MLKNVSLGVGVLVVFVVVPFLFIATAQPDIYRVRRAVIVDAPTSQIVPFVANFEKWQLWSPFENRDADVKRVYNANASLNLLGLNKTYEWDENDAGGRGRVRITKYNMEIDKSGKSETRLEMLFNSSRRFIPQSELWFVFTSKDENKTEVVLVMIGVETYSSKLAHMFFDLDTELGPEIEEGLAELKAIAEKPADPSSGTAL